MKEFETSARRAQQDEDPNYDGSTPFEIKERDSEGNVTHTELCRAYKPNDGQLAVLMATTGRHSSEQEQIAGLINFFVAVLDEPSHTYVVNRLLDRRDEFGIREVQAIMEWMIEEWSGRPTQRPSVSTPSPPSTGPSSTASTPAMI